MPSPVFLLKPVVRGRLRLCEFLTRCFLLGIGGGQGWRRGVEWLKEWANYSRGGARGLTGMQSRSGISASTLVECVLRTVRAGLKQC